VSLRLNSLRELDQLLASRKSRSKYHNKPNELAGEKYRSKRERDRHLRLLMEQRAGLIANLRREVSFVLAPTAMVAGKNKPALRYFADFTYTRNGALVVEDAKGVKTAVYVVKRHLMKVLHGIDILET